MASIALVWFKRDLRIEDHAALLAASRCDRVLSLYVVEPEWLGSEECDPQHLVFARSCVEHVQHELALRGLPTLVRFGEVCRVLSQLHRRWHFTHLFSHEETGPSWSYARDLAVAAWCKAHAVTWQEFPQSGVVRRLPGRKGWGTLWQKRMDAPLIEVPGRFRGVNGVQDQEKFLDWKALNLGSAREVPAGGTRAGRKVMDEFLAYRGGQYRYGISSPLTAPDACSRLSPHLAFGTISMRSVHQATEARIGALRAMRTEQTDRFAAHLRAFSSRLRWHCHFIQKLEDEPSIEFHNMARAYDGLREDSFSEDRFQAWCAGRTGFPMVDACMRSLLATGWLNFRMRAMLVSFAAYHLWLHWRKPGLFLARQFLDFEAGIHWSQMQMQSGTTGINTFRIYSPEKQALDHDPRGIFIRRWVPEWGTPDYPPPIVDSATALQFAKTRMYAVRQTAVARKEADVIQERHGSRKSGLKQTGRRRSRAEQPTGGTQGVLFD